VVQECGKGVTRVSQKCLQRVESIRPTDVPQKQLGKLGIRGTQVAFCVHRVEVREEEVTCRHSHLVPQACYKIVTRILQDCYKREGKLGRASNEQREEEHTNALYVAT
jgi:hypothetical protein